MDNKFEIEISYNSKHYIFPAELVATTYSYKVIVTVNGNNISFEPDEERNYRAILGYDNLVNAETIDKYLLQEIANQLIILFKD